MKQTRHPGRGAGSWR